MLIEYEAGAAGRQGDLEWITFDVARYRTSDGQTGLRIVRTGREDERRPPTALLMTGLRIDFSRAATASPMSSSRME